MERCVQTATALKYLLLGLRHQMLERRHVCLCVYWRSRVDMIVLKLFLFLQGLLLAARCEVWPRDQELKDGEDEQLNQHQGALDHGNPYEHFGTGHDSAGTQKQGRVVSETIHYPLEHRHFNPSHGSPSEDVSVDAEGGSANSNIHPKRTG